LVAQGQERTKAIGLYDKAFVIGDLAFGATIEISVVNSGFDEKILGLQGQEFFFGHEIIIHPVFLIHSRSAGRMGHDFYDPILFAQEFADFGFSAGGGSYQENHCLIITALTLLFNKIKKHSFRFVSMSLLLFARKPNKMGPSIMKTTILEVEEEKGMEERVTIKFPALSMRPY
jgi:hypothetical protein